MLSLHILYISFRIPGITQNCNAYHTTICTQSSYLYYTTYLIDIVIFILVLVLVTVQFIVLVHFVGMLYLIDITVFIIWREVLAWWLQ